MAGFGTSGRFEIPFTAGDGTGVIESVANPEGVDVYITRALLVITTPSTGASTLDIGTDASATTADDTIFDGKSGATAGVFDNHITADAGTNGLPYHLWDSAAFFNIAEASGDVTGIVGKVILDYTRVA